MLLPDLQRVWNVPQGEFTSVNKMPRTKTPEVVQTCTPDAELPADVLGVEVEGDVGSVCGCELVPVAGDPGADVAWVGAEVEGFAAPDDSNGVVGTGTSEDVGDSGVLQL